MLPPPSTNRLRYMLNVTSSAVDCLKRLVSKVTSCIASRALDSAYLPTLVVTVVFADYSVTRSDMPSHRMEQFHQQLTSD